LSPRDIPGGRQSAVASVRGTKFEVYIKADGTMIVKLFDGELDFDGKNHVHLTSGQQATADPQGTSDPPARSSPIQTIRSDRRWQPPTQSLRANAGHRAGLHRRAAAQR